MNKVKLTSGPNMPGFLVLGLMVWISWEQESPYPIIFFIGFCFLCTLPTLLLLRWNSNQDRKLAEDFPCDPVIQEK